MVIVHIPETYVGTSRLVFPSSLSFLRFFSCPNNEGIDPDSWLLLSHSSLRDVSCPNSEGIEPDNLFQERHSPVTCPASLVWTPCHSLRGLSVFQFVLLFQFAPSVASYSAISIARSSFSLLINTYPPFTSLTLRKQSQITTAQTQALQ